MSQMDFGTNNQFGDMKIRDVAGRDILSPKISVSTNPVADDRRREILDFFTACEELERDRFDDHRLSRFVNRTKEISIFEQVLNLEDAVRILVIQDSKRNGKSLLLRKFRQICRDRQDRIPVSYVSCNGIRSIIQFISKIIVNKSSGIFNTYKDTLSQVRSGSLDRFTQRQHASELISNLPINNDGSTQIILADSQTEFLVHEQLIRKCVDAFLYDLTTHCTKQPFVLMIDEFQRAVFQNHFFQYFLEPFVLNRHVRPHNFIVIIATTESFEIDFEYEIDDEYNRIAKLIHPLEPFSEDTIEECMKNCGFKEINRSFLTTFHTLQSLDRDIAGIIELMETFASIRQ